VVSSRARRSPPPTIRLNQYVGGEVEARASFETSGFYLLVSPSVREPLHWRITANFVAILALARGFYTVWTRVSGHSVRVGITQALLALNINLAPVMRAGRWKDTRMPMRYGEKCWQEEERWRSCESAESGQLNQKGRFMFSRRQ